MPTPVLSKPEQREPIVVAGENENVQQLPDFTQHGMVQFDQDNKAPLDFLAARRARIVKQLNPSHNARAVVELGDIHLAKKQLRHAENAYRDAIKKDPNLVDAYRKIIPLLIIRQQLKAANDYYLRLIKLTSSHPDILYEYLTFRMTFFSDDEKIITEVKAELQRLVKAYPEREDFKNALGILWLIHKSDISKAASCFRDALEVQPKSIDALNNLGTCLQREGKHAEAYKYYRKALKVNTKYPAAYENIASSYVAQDKLDAALSALLEGQSLGLTYTPLWDHNTGWLMLLTGKLEDAKKWYLSKTKQEPNNNLLFNNLGVCYQNLGKLKLAEKSYQKAAELTLTIKKQHPDYNDPRALNAFYNLCRLLYRSGNYEKLEVVSKHILALNSEDPAGLYYIGSARIQLKKFVAARQALEKSININPDAIEPYIDLSFLLTSILHEYADAIELLDKALSKGMTDEYIVNNLAYAYIKSDNIERAEQFLNLKDKYPNTSATKGLIEFRKGNFAAGNKLYEKAIKAIPDNKKDEATQVWRYEQADFWFRALSYKKAKSYIEKAKLLGKGYFVYNDVLKLEKEIKAKLSK